MKHIPISQWEKQGHIWPTASGWYNLLRPERKRDELIDAGVATWMHGRWVIDQHAWERYCAEQGRRRGAAA